MDAIKSFEKIGMSTRDSRVYIALLQDGVSSIRKISERTHLNRGSVYESIKALQHVGLVNHIQSNVNKKYFAERPEKILELIEQKKEELDDFQYQTIQTIIPKLTQSATYLPYPNIKFYEDDDGIATILKDIIKTCEALENKEYLVISSKPLRKYLYDRFPNLPQKRIEKGIYVRVLAIGEGGTIDDLSERKWLPDIPGRYPASYTYIYGDKFATIALNNGINPFGVVIENKGVADMQKLLFEQLWNATD